MRWVVLAVVGLALGIVGVWSSTHGWVWTGRVVNLVGAVLAGWSLMALWLKQGQK